MFPIRRTCVEKTHQVILHIFIEISTHTKSSSLLELSVLLKQKILFGSECENTIKTINKNAIL